MAEKSIFEDPKLIDILIRENCDLDKEILSFIGQSKEFQGMIKRCALRMTSANRDDCQQQAYFLAVAFIRRNAELIIATLRSGQSWKRKFNNALHGAVRKYQSRGLFKRRNFQPRQAIEFVQRTFGLPDRLIRELANISKQSQLEKLIKQHPQFDAGLIRDAFEALKQSRKGQLAGETDNEYQWRKTTKSEASFSELERANDDQTNGMSFVPEGNIEALHERKKQKFRDLLRESSEKTHYAVYRIIVGLDEKEFEQITGIKRQLIEQIYASNDCESEIDRIANGDLALRSSLQEAFQLQFQVLTKVVLAHWVGKITGEKVDRRKIDKILDELQKNIFEKSESFFYL